MDFDDKARAFLDKAFAKKADALVHGYRGWLKQAQAGLPLAEKVRRGFSTITRPTARSRSGWTRIFE